MQKFSQSLAYGLLLAFFLMAAVLAFRTVLPSDAILQTQDMNIGLAMNWSRFGAVWQNGWTGSLWGMRDAARIHPSFYLMWLSPRFYINWLQGLALCSLAFFVALYLRDKRVHIAACALGGLLAAFVGTNFSLASAGHLGKYGGFLFLGPALFALGRMGATKRAAWGAIAGACVCGMFFEQQDTGLFFATFLVPVGVYEGVRACGGWRPVPLVKLVAPAVCIAAVGLAGILYESFRSGLVSTPGDGDAETAQQKWDYITQWSQPPEESLDFIAPGWMGWGSGDMGGPYYGRTGQSAEWPLTRQGFMNYRTETVYIGGLALLFACMAAGFAFREPGTERRRLVWLWGALWLAGLLLSFGKYFPLYRLVALLPGYSSIRNPNKFLHFFQISWGILAAFGLDGAIRLMKENGKALRGWCYTAATVAGLFFLFGFALSVNPENSAARFTAIGWPLQYAQAIAKVRAHALLYAGFSFTLAAVVLFVLGSPKIRKWAAVAIWIPALAVVLDSAFILAPHYVKLLPATHVDANPLTEFLHANLGNERTAFPALEGPYGQFVNILFPAQGIPTTSVTAVPRPPPDYQTIWRHVPPQRLWELTGVSHILLSSGTARQILADPALSQHMKPVFGYTVSDGGKIRAVSNLAQAPHLVFELQPRPQRLAAISAARILDDEATLAALSSPAFIAGRELLLAPDQAVPDWMPTEADDGFAETEIQLISHRPGRYIFTVETDRPVWLRIAEAYAPEWRASVGGTDTPVFRADYMFQAIPVPAGHHEIILRYSLSKWPIYLQGGALLAGALAALLLLLRREPRAAA